MLGKEKFWPRQLPGSTPLLWVSSYQAIKAYIESDWPDHVALEVARLLLEHGADILDAKCKEGNTVYRDRI